jgi:hypothetical protein
VRVYSIPYRDRLRDRGISDYRRMRRDQALSRLEVLTEGSRGAAKAGVSVVYANHTFYPSCGDHGAMNRVGSDVWRCLATGCNVGARFEVQS